MRKMSTTKKTARLQTANSLGNISKINNEETQTKKTKN